MLAKVDGGGRVEWKMGNERIGEIDSQAASSFCPILCAHAGRISAGRRRAGWSTG